MVVVRRERALARRAGVLHLGDASGDAAGRGARGIARPELHAVLGVVRDGHERRPRHADEHVLGVGVAAFHAHGQHVLLERSVLRRVPQRVEKRCQLDPRQEHRAAPVLQGASRNVYLAAVIVARGHAPEDDRAAHHLTPQLVAIAGEVAREEPARRVELAPDPRFRDADVRLPRGDRPRLGGAASAVPAVMIAARTSSSARVTRVVGLMPRPRAPRAAARRDRARECLESPTSETRRSDRPSRRRRRRRTAGTDRDRTASRELS